MKWKKGRGKLGLFAPLLGDWVANSNSIEANKPECHRQFQYTLEKKYIQLDVQWLIPNKTYIDHTLIGLNEKKEICFWSFTSDGKNSTGKLADVSDLHPEAIGFEAEMPAGLARQAYWPADEGGFYWVVESKTKKGWNRFVQQHFTRKT
ncbi:MAG: hypothetical protein AAF798_19130 [Bacteroidota bacterium]